MTPSEIVVANEQKKLTVAAGGVVNKVTGLALTKAENEPKKEAAKKA